MTGEDLMINIGAQVAGALAGLASVDVAMDKLELNTARAAKKVRASTALMTKALIGMTTVGGVAAVAGAKNIMNTYSTFEQTVANAASVTGAVGEEYDKTRARIEEISKVLGKSTVFSSNQAADALYDLASAGYDVRNMVADDLRPIMNLAAATQTDLTETTQTVTSTLGQFGMVIGDSGRVADVFARTIGSSKATLDKLTLSMRYIGPVAQSMGISFEDVNAMLGELYNNGFRGEQAGRALRAGLSRMLDPTADAKKALGELNIAIADVNPEVNDVTSIMEMFAEKQMSANQAIRLFGIEAAPAMLALIKNTDDVRALEEVIANSGNAAQYMAEKQLDTLQGSSILLKSALEVLKIEMGQVFGEDLQNINYRLQEFVNVLIDKVPEAAETLRGWLADLQPTWENLKESAGSAAGIVKDFFTAFTGKDATIDDAIQTIEDVTGAIATLLSFIDRHPTITKFAAALLTAVVVFSYVLPLVTAAATAWGVLTTIVGIAGGVMAGTTTAAAALGAIVAALGGPVTLIAAAIAILAAMWATNMFGIRDKTKAVLAFVMGLFTKFVNFIGPTLAKVYNKFADMINKIRPLLAQLGYDMGEMGHLEFDQVYNPADQWNWEGKNSKQKTQTNDWAYGNPFSGNPYSAYGFDSYTGGGAGLEQLGMAKEDNLATSKAALEKLEGIKDTIKAEPRKVDIKMNVTINNQSSVSGLQGAIARSVAAGVHNKTKVV